ncbi:MAG: NUDIX domain-containing protein [Christensenellaceae bacterium]|nr:NUDIX domain-containing protein [Christensenellaceae bacterium]
MEERFAIPAVAAIIEYRDSLGRDCIIIQKRMKENGGILNGLMEIPAGKIREYEWVFDALKREVKEETGLDVVSVTGFGGEEEYSCKRTGYRVMRIMPYSVTQNVSGGYSVILLTFLCRAEGTVVKSTDETQEIHVAELTEVEKLINENEMMPIHIPALRKYISEKRKAAGSAG